MTGLTNDYHSAFPVSDDPSGPYTLGAGTLIRAVMPPDDLQRMYFEASSDGSRWASYYGYSVPAIGDVSALREEQRRPRQLPPLHGASRYVWVYSDDGGHYDYRLGRQPTEIFDARYVPSRFVGVVAYDADNKIIGIVTPWTLRWESPGDGGYYNWTDGDLLSAAKH